MDTSESPTPWKSSWRERRELGRAAAMSPSINSSYLRLRKDYSMEEVLHLLISQQMTVETKITTVL